MCGGRHQEEPLVAKQWAQVGRARGGVDGAVVHLQARLTPLSTGLYPASSAAQGTSTGYHRVWVRDNVYVAFAQLQAGRPEAAAAVARALLTSTRAQPLQRPVVERELHSAGNRAVGVGRKYTEEDGPDV